MTENHYSKLFLSADGEKLYQQALRAVNDFSMASLLSSGVLVGFSGGADSLFLLLFLAELKKRSMPEMKITAVHVNHGIRGEEAERDSQFSHAVAEALGVEFISVFRDVPRFAEENSLGTEEAARNIRYSVFSDIIAKREDISCVATAHNSSDNFETVLFNMVRGTGIRGLSGISPIRDNIVRPLIYISGEEIRKLLNDNNIEFVLDSTNFSSEYTRNYIRNELAPRFLKISSDPEKTVGRMCENLRCDADFIDSCAKVFFDSECLNASIDNSKLLSLHPALFSRVAVMMAKKEGISSLEYVHIRSIEKMLKTGKNFKISLPNSKIWLSEYGNSKIISSENERAFCQKLHLGINKIDGFSDVILISEKKTDISSLNVYKISIQAEIKFDIINEDLFVRSKKDGDSYIYNKVNHKLKKLFIDSKTPKSERQNVPVFTDGKNIIWVPGFAVSDSEDDFSTGIYIYILSPKDVGKERFFIPRKTKK